MNSFFCQHYSLPCPTASPFAVVHTVSSKGTCAAFAAPGNRTPILDSPGPEGSEQGGS